MSPKHTVVVDADFVDIMPRFLEIRRTELQQIQAALKGADYEQISFLGHRLKGSGGAYGIEELSRLGAAIEAAGSAQKLEEASGLVESLAEFLANLEVVFDGE